MRSSRVRAARARSTRRPTMTEVAGLAQATRTRASAGSCSRARTKIRVWARRLFGGYFGIAPNHVAVDSPLARHGRERALHQGGRRSEAGRAVVAGDVRLSHAALDRHIPAGRVRDRGLSGRLQRRRGPSDLWRPFSATASVAPIRRPGNGSGWWPIASPGTHPSSRGHSAMLQAKWTPAPEHQARSYSHFRSGRQIP